MLLQHFFKCPSSIRHCDSTPRLSECESPPITTSPPIKFILANRWQNGSENLGIDSTSCFWFFLSSLTAIPLLLLLAFGTSLTGSYRSCSFHYNSASGSSFFQRVEDDEPKIFVAKSDHNIIYFQADDYSWWTRSYVRMGLIIIKCFYTSDYQHFRWTY